MSEKDCFCVGLVIGAFLMGIIMRVSFALTPEFYGDRCLNSTEYHIDTIKVYNGNHIKKVEYKFSKD